MKHKRELSLTMLVVFVALTMIVGPALFWSPKRFDQKLTLITKWLHEYEAERRIEGDHIFLSFALSF
jgi:hypothetical protein